ncbi:stage V sporulation protein D [Tissierella creatinophila]|uniref:Stage V sporulation protein D n=1 Tax=Tissierella creatinophila DSM 6911 TaxID=1123403 RepID=A0A1U7M9K0_TISCR|nr:stage V sporulation protein D [Tissierella creatinophila]OLS03878.1 stage V sporulation protein D [Tissierella creatinophila DSM 6911]
MKESNKIVKKRLKITLGLSFFIVFALILRLGNIQIFRNHELKKGALEQWTKSIDIRAKRGTIYDRRGKKLAISVNSFTVWATPADIKESKKTAETVSSILQLEEDEVYKKLVSNQSTQKIKQWITREEANELRKLKLRGITIVEDNKRYYPNGNFASYILGFTDIDNNGLDGIEYVYNDYLTGRPGKWMKMTDGANRQLPYDGEKVHDPEDGSSLVLTIDETIQHFAEKAAEKALLDTKAKGVSVIMMEIETGEILSLVNKPDFDPNSPREPVDENLKKQWDKLPAEEVQKKWFDLWRNFTINDIYEPGSTFKLITAAAALEENSANLDTHYYCKGTIKIQGRTLKCANWYNPHGDQTFRDAVNNSCNVAFVNMGLNLGRDNLYKYTKAFGFGEKTGVDLLGEQAGIIPNNVENIKEINLATLSYGHSIAVTPMQLVTAVSAIANGGDLLKPKLVKQILNSEGDVIKEFKSETVRKVISKETSDTMLSLMETVVSEGSGSKAYIPGYKVGGKTGTAQKIIDGRYKQGKYIGSFISVAPIDDPKIAMLVVVDEPSGTYYGGSVAAPVAKSIFEDTFNYLEIPPKFTKEEKEEIEELVKVPDVRNKKIGEAGKILMELGLKHTTEYLELTDESIILDQFPLPGVEIKKGSVIDLFIDFKPNEEIVMPFLTDKKKEEIIKILDEMNLKYEFKGQGKSVLQSPLPGEKINFNTKVIVEFK